MTISSLFPLSHLNITTNMPIPAPLGEPRHADIVAGAGPYGGPAQRAGGAEPRAEHL